MLKSLFHPGVFALGAVLAALGTALALGLAISLIYRVLSRERGGFPVVLAVMPALVSLSPSSTNSLFSYTRAAGASRSSSPSVKWCVVQE